MHMTVPPSPLTWHHCFRPQTGQGFLGVARAQSFPVLFARPLPFDS
jgi:hypothetical protein